MTDIQHILETASFAGAEARVECERRLRAALAHAEATERQRDEAFTAGAEAMRENIACVFEESDMPNTARDIRALPIPAQEVK